MKEMDKTSTGGWHGASGILHEADAVIAALRDAGESPFRMGEVKPLPRRSRPRYYGNAP